MMTRAFRPAASMLAAAVLSAAAPVGATGPAPLQAAIERFKPFVSAGIARSLAAARTMREQIAGHDLAGAQRAWIAARSGWEQAEIVSDVFFPDLDDAIDAWPDGKQGFHAIEARLFGAHKTDALAETDALIARLQEFEATLQSTTLTPQGLLDGTAKLAYEIGENKADGGESQFSGTSLGDIRANLAGIAEVWRTVFGPVLQARDPKRAAAIADSLAALGKLAGAADLKSLDETALRRRSEDLALAFQDAAPALALDPPNLGN
jgi:iron uptake system component EfeO